MKELMQAIASGEPVVLKIYAENCAPCERMAPVFDQLRESHSDKATFFNMNMKELDQNFLVMRGVRSAPTVLMFKFGVEECRLVGAENTDLEHRLATFLLPTDLSGDGYVECESCT